jgi:CubicO group peptidase (beta-lactamase class C family)
MSPQWFKPSGPDVAAFAEFDEAMKAFMTQANIRGGTLALIKDGRLVYARGYTYDEPNSLQIQPTHLFRIASCTKPLTSMAIYQLIEKFNDPNKLSLDSKVESIVMPLLQSKVPNAPKPSNDPKPSNPRQDGNYFNAITVRHLLSHQGGWNRDVAGEPTFYHDPDVAAALGVNLPISRYQLAAWGVAQQMQFYPGSETHYSNFGYSLLGRVIEQMTGQTYIEAVKQRLLKPLGINHPRLSLPLAGDRAPGEVTYQVIPPENRPSMMHSDRHNVPLQYGGENNANFDSFGGWIMSAPDYARVLAAFTMKQSPMPKVSADDMLVWGKYSLASGVKVYDHGGLLPGTWSYVAARSDNTGIVVLWNTTTAVQNFIFKGITYGIGNHPTLWHKLIDSIPANQWPTHNLFPPMLNELPIHNPSMTVTAAWQPGGVDEIRIHDWSYADYRQKYDQLWEQGWRLHLLENHVVNNQVRYTAVWRPSTSGEIQVYEWSYEDFRKKYDELWNQGWRLHILNNFVVNGQVLYTAVWRPSTSGEIQVYGWSYEDLRKKYDELWNQGWRLHILNTFVVNGQVLYTAVWRPSTSGEIQVYGWSYEDYRKKYDGLWNQGWRLHILNNFVANGQVLYTAVWKPSNEGEIQVYGWSYEDYRQKYDELWSQGWRLKLINTY